MLPSRVRFRGCSALAVYADADVDMLVKLCFLYERVCTLRECHIRLFAPVCDWVQHSVGVSFIDSTCKVFGMREWRRGERDNIPLRCQIRAWFMTAVRFDRAQTASFW
jgi:hypothetical protein